MSEKDRKRNETQRRTKTESIEKNKRGEIESYTETKKQTRRELKT